MDKQDYTITIKIKSDYKNKAYLREMIDAVQNQMAIVDKMYIGERLVYDDTGGGFDDEVMLDIIWEMNNGTPRPRNNK